MILQFSVLILFILLFSTYYREKNVFEFSYYVYNYFIFLLFVVLIFIDTSIDKDGYELYYSSVKTLINYNTDILFNLCILIFKYFNIRFDFFYAFCGLANYVLLILIINTISKLKEKFIFIVCYFSFCFLLKDLIQMRNALALKFVLLAVLNSKRIFKSIFLFITAILIHNSVIIFLPVVFLYKRIRFSLKFIFILIFLFFVVYFNENAMKYFLSKIPLLGGRIGIYMQFFSRKYDALSLFHFFRICIYLLLFFYVFRTTNDKIELFSLCSVIFGYSIRVFFIDLSLLTGRLAENCYIFECFLMMRMYEKKRKLFYYFCPIFVFLYLKMIIGNLELFHAYKNYLF